jgi:hypothetical protein
MAAGRIDIGGLEIHLEVLNFRIRRSDSLISTDNEESDDTNTQAKLPPRDLRFTGGPTSMTRDGNSEKPIPYFLHMLCRVRQSCNHRDAMAKAATNPVSSSSS